MEECAKVGAGETASGRHGQPPAVDGITRWLFDEWEKARKRDQAVVLALRRSSQVRMALAFIMGGVAGALAAATYFSTGG